MTKTPQQLLADYSDKELSDMIVRHRQQINRSPIGTNRIAACGHPARSWMPVCSACLVAEFERRHEEYVETI